MAKTYETQLGDTWDVISFKVYGSEMFVSDLVEANWRFREVMIFGAGSVISVPELTEVRRDAAKLPPWRR